MTTAVPSRIMWQRRTNRVIAAGIIVIGLTMMVSNVAQCIYIGMFFIVIALVWLSRMAMTERKTQPPRPELLASPVLFLVNSDVTVRRPTTLYNSAADKPPSYDQILSDDGLPPDYSTIVIPDDLPKYQDVVKEDSASTTVKVTVDGSSDSEQQQITNNKLPSKDQQASTSKNTFWNSLTRGIGLTRSFSLPKREGSKRYRNPSTTSSGHGNTSTVSSGHGNTNTASSQHRNPSTTSSGDAVANKECSLSILQVSTLPQDVPHSSRYLNNEIIEVHSPTSKEISSDKPITEAAKT